MEPKDTFGVLDPSKIYVHEYGDVRRLGGMFEILMVLLDRLELDGWSLNTPSSAAVRGVTRKLFPSLREAEPHEVEIYNSMGNSPVPTPEATYVLMTGNSPYKTIALNSLDTFPETWNNMQYNPTKRQGRFPSRLENIQQN